MRILWITTLVCLFVGIAAAQDPTKAEPTHYKLDFENEHVQVVSVHYGPHEKSNLHEHPGGVVVVLSAAHLRYTDDKGKAREVFAKPGEARWNPPVKHKVENLSDDDYRAVYVGIKGMSSAKSASPETIAEETALALAKVKSLPTPAAK